MQVILNFVFVVSLILVSYHSYVLTQDHNRLKTSIEDVYKTLALQTDSLVTFTENEQVNADKDDIRDSEIFRLKTNQELILNAVNALITDAAVGGHLAEHKSEEKVK